MVKIKAEKLVKPEHRKILRLLLIFNSLFSVVECLVIEVNEGVSRAE